MCAQHVRMKWSAPSQINLYILAVHVSGEWMAATLQHYLMLCFYFSHVSLGELSLKKKKKEKSQHNKLIPLWF